MEARPGSLEWLADSRPDEPVLHGPQGSLTRRDWERAAARLADALAAEGTGPGDLLAASGELSPAWHTLAWAAAKLGAGLVALPPLTAPPPGARAVPQASDPVGTRAPEARDERRSGPGSGPQEPGRVGTRRLSGGHPLPDSVVYSRSGRAVRRSFAARDVGRIGGVLADLVAQLRAMPGSAVLVAGPTSDATLAFLANVVLVGGGSVTTPGSDLLAALDRGGHDLLALTPAALADLMADPVIDWEPVDLLDVRTVLTGGAPVPARTRAAVADAFGPDALVDVLTTADTGAIGVRSGEADAFRLCDGVEARLTPGGRLEIRSPLAATPGWTPTGDRAELDGRDVRLSA